MDPIILSAIKKAKKELEEKHRVSAQTLDDLKGALADLKDTKLPGWVQDILTKVDQSTNNTGTTLSQIKSSLEAKLSPWTDTRAAKLDNLDAKVSSRADGKDWTVERAGKVDLLDVAVSSRLSKTDFDTGRAALKSDISGKIDTQGVALSTAVGGVKADVAAAQAKAILKANQKLSVYNLDLDKNPDIKPSKTPPGTALYQVNGSGKISYFAVSLTAYSATQSRPSGLIFEFELDGKPLGTIKAIGYYSGNYKATPIVLCSTEGVILSNVVKSLLSGASIYPYSLKGDAGVSGYSLSIFDAKNTNPYHAVNLYFGGEELRFKKSFKLKVVDYLSGYDGDTFDFSSNAALSLGVLLD